MKEVNLDLRQEHGMMSMTNHTQFIIQEIVNTKVLKSSLCYDNDAHILRRDITILASPATQVAFKSFSLMEQP